MIRRTHLCKKYFKNIRNAPCDKAVNINPERDDFSRIGWFYPSKRLRWRNPELRDNSQEKSYQSNKKVICIKAC